MRSLEKFSATFLLIAAISGCASAGHEQPDLVSVGYRIADKLAASAPLSSDPTKPVLVGSAVNIDNLTASSTFGRTLTEIISGRLAQHGIPISELKLRNAVNLRPQGELVLSRQAADVTKSYNAQAVVAGTYSIVGDTVYISYKVVRVVDNAIIGSADEAIPYDE